MEAIEAAGVASATKRAGLPLIVVIIAGVVGSLGAVAAFGKGTVNVSPFTVELSVTPLAGTTTTLSMRAPKAGSPGVATASTHGSPITFDATIVGIDIRPVTPSSPSTCPPAQCSPLPPDDPQEIAQWLADNGKSEIRTFGIKVGLISLAGGFAAALLFSLGNWKRGLAGAVAGTLLMGILAFAAQQTYDTTKFRDTQFRPSGSSSP